MAERLAGMCLLALATVTADGRPQVGPDGTGPEWEEFLDSSPIFWRIEAERMFTFIA